VNWKYVGVASRRA